MALAIIFAVVIGASKKRCAPSTGLPRGQFLGGRRAGQASAIVSAGAGHHDRRYPGPGRAGETAHLVYRSSNLSAKQPASIIQPYHGSTYHLYDFNPGTGMPEECNMARWCCCSLCSACSDRYNHTHAGTLPWS
jgi:hypothetical protein